MLMNETSSFFLLLRPRILLARFIVSGQEIGGFTLKSLSSQEKACTKTDLWRYSTEMVPLVQSPYIYMCNIYICNIYIYVTDIYI